MTKLIAFINLALLLTACVISNDKIEKRVKHLLNKKHGVEVEIEKVERAKNLGENRYRYYAYLKDDELGGFSGIYNSKKDDITNVSMGFILFNSRYRHEIEKLVGQDKAIVNAYIDAIATDRNIDYQNISLKELSNKYDDTKLRLHIYLFSNSTKDQVNWKELTPVIDYLKDYPDLTFDLVFTFYPETLLNQENVRAYNFRFGTEYLGVEDNFEVNNMDRRLDHFEALDTDLNTLASKWNDKLPTSEKD
ncbi:hypothetical protein OO013_03990 [Mangrovivirga sp. M17]|uniref:Lipoprotein n=1 Tax=Mangrovivirga halotolerans TaxID=2993936 RepID=A0ABT3RN40_9BACT|nr:hypothetical protein [Mangrovivirga halotolerans]MCX2743010.1 hypothetical protein [Mangrovivirga halotolerans]